jgi:hypothetical protein
MRVLSIDIDYIMGPTIGLYSDIGWDESSGYRWEKFFSETEYTESDLHMDTGNLLFCYETFVKALCKSDCEVLFSYDHDNILYSLSNHNNLDIINIDHHADIIYPKVYDNETSILNSLKEQYKLVSKYNKVSEGTWVAWLRSKNKINSYTWIGNKSGFDLLYDCEKNYHSGLIPRFKMVTKEEYSIEDYRFDHIFVCLSPQYIPKIHWHYFTMFLIAYEQIKNKSAKIEEWGSKKFETEVRHSFITDEILHKRSANWK